MFIFSKRNFKYEYPRVQDILVVGRNNGRKEINL